MFWIGWMFLMLAFSIIALFAIATAVEAVSPGSIERLIERLGFSEETRGWEVREKKVRNLHEEKNPGSAACALRSGAVRPYRICGNRYIGRI